MKSSPSGREEHLLAEAVGLAHALDLDVVHTESVALERRRPSTLLGSGVVERVGEVVKGDGNGMPKVAVALVDAALTPVQQRNLEKAWNCKVVDRTGLILEIFAARARTREGRLQVELAALTYQKSRLVRTWTHLERQRGGTRALGGPGETQIESDRRQISERIVRVKRELGDVKRTRELHREARRRVPYPVVALVGYTNAGKSTLFNRLTRANVKVQDQLFATLDPTMRALDLPSGRTAILSDTVGFISELPHELVNAFHATLEEVVEADLIVHVRDAAHPDSAAQKADVLTVLREMGLDEAIEESLIEVLNKIDLLPADEKQVAINRAGRSNKPMLPLSAVTGEGCDAMVRLIDDRITRNFKVIEVTLKHSDGAAVAWLYDHGEVVSREDAPDAIHLKVRLDAAHLARFQQRLSQGH
ncbi:MAG: GTPase HflX [Rhodospirillales bacterium RIFCSPLOWO2_01_FULL_65_14]|nr:MAG: GTPase HflX [Rhodospirillales bacterium RIFCSPLOWO2_01_FULL_65_14]